MKITFISNACAIYEAQGFKLLADPWLSPSAFYGSWVHDPPIKTRPQDVTDCDAVYISHIHQDHLDPDTLFHFPRHTRFVVIEDQFCFVRKKLEQLGFSNFIRIKDKESARVGPFTLTMYGPFVKHPFYGENCEVGNIVDSALMIEADGHKVLNANDNSLTVETARAMRARHGEISVAQLNYNAAGPFPAAFDNFDIATKKQKHSELIERGLAHMVAMARELKAHYVMPFAGAYKLAPSLGHMNPYLGTTSQENAAHYAKRHDLQVINLAEGEVFELTPVSYIIQHERAQFDFMRDRRQPTEEMLYAARAKLWKTQQRFNYFPELYMKVNDFGFFWDEETPRTIDDRKPAAMPRLECSLHPALLYRILTKEAHWNNAEVGCLIRFYREPDIYLPDVHLLMSYFHLETNG